MVKGRMGEGEVSYSDDGLASVRLREDCSTTRL